MLLAHLSSISQGKFHNFMVSFVSTWLVVVTISILFWQSLTISSHSQLFNITIYSDMESINFPIGAGIRFGMFEYSTGYIWPAAISYFLISVGFIVNYIRLDPVYETKRILLAKVLWVLSFGLVSVWLIPRAFPFFPFNFSPILIVFATICLGIIPIFIPEGLLITKSQVAAVVPLYEEIEEPGNQMSKRKQKVREYLNEVQKAKVKK